MASGRGKWVWAMYDFANSGYTTVVITATSTRTSSLKCAHAPWATFVWTCAARGRRTAIICTGPLSAHMPTRTRRKRKLLAVILQDACSHRVPRIRRSGDLVLAIALVALSNFFFGTGENIVAAFSRRSRLTKRWGACPAGDGRSLLWRARGPGSGSRYVTGRRPQGIPA